jgi:hypothetical protein
MFEAERKHGTQLLGLLETSSSRQFLSLKHSGLAWRASPLTRRRTSQIVSPGRLSITGARNETGGQRDDLNKSTLHAVPATPDPAYFLVQFADDEELEPAALAFFASRFSFSDLLAAVFELFEPPLSLLAMVTSSRRRGRVLTVPPWTPRPISSTLRGEPERDGFAGQMEVGPGKQGQESLAYGGTSRKSPGGTTVRRPAHDFDPALGKKGRAVLRGRPLRGPPCKHADLFDQPSGRPHHDMPPHRGLPRFRALAAALRCSRYAPKWALTAGG